MCGQQKICTRCVMDTSAPDIRFDAKGICQYCHIHDRLIHQYEQNGDSVKKFEEIVKNIIHEGKNNEYNCIVGVSGGRDSTYTLYKAVQCGLRPLAVHFDNGWNSDIAVSNIKNATEKLDVDLYTHVADWEEFKDLQISFLKASIPDAEIPTDYVITSVLLQKASEYNIKNILVGCSFKTEGIVPLSWTYMDGRYIKSIHKKFGKKRITSFPIMGIKNLIYYSIIKRIKFIHLPAYVDYCQNDVDSVLTKELGWKYYGGHHHESVFTEFFQSYYLPLKFNIDKRKLEYSALVRIGDVTREDALKALEEPYPNNKNIVEYTINKLGLTDDEFKEIMGSPRKSFKDYPSYYPIIRACKVPIKLACKINIFPYIFYEKYLGGK